MAHPPHRPGQEGRPKTARTNPNPPWVVVAPETLDLRERDERSHSPTFVGPREATGREWTERTQPADFRSNTINNKVLWRRQRAPAAIVGYGRPSLVRSPHRSRISQWAQPGREARNAAARTSSPNPVRIPRRKSLYQMDLGKDAERTQRADSPAAGVAWRWRAAWPSKRLRHPVDPRRKPRRKSGRSDDAMRGQARAIAGRSPCAPARRGTPISGCVGRHPDCGLERPRIRG